MFQKKEQLNLNQSIILVLGFIFFICITLNSKVIANNTIFFSQQEKVNLLDEKTSFLLPIRFKIPKLNINSSIEYVGVTSDGAMDVPEGPIDVAWYKFGSRPGELGSAVIAGHSGWKDGLPAVFDDLYKLRKGDKIYIEDEKGKIITFIVRESKIYDENRDTEDVFGLKDGKSHLNLITCEGAWNETEKGRPNRLIVFSDRE